MPGGRPRCRRTAWLPPGVYEARGVYILRHQGRQRILAPIGAPKGEVLQKYADLARDEARDGITLQKLVEQYIASARFKGLASGTQDDAKKAFRVALSTKTSSGDDFGTALVSRLTPVTMRLYMDRRGESSPTRADRELAYLSTVFAWGRERGLCDSNPCTGVRRFNPEARTRYVTHDEYDQRLRLALELGRPDVAAAMEFAYLCRLRLSEVAGLEDVPAVIRDDGILAKRAKGSKTQIIEWSDRLHAAVKLARSVKRRAVHSALITSAASGYRLTPRQLSDGWSQVRKEAIARGHAVDWTFHDLKAKGVSDFEGDKHVASGHKTQRMTEVYDRVPGRVRSTR